MSSITRLVGVSIDSSVGSTVVGLDETVLTVVGVAGNVGSSEAGPTISAGSMLPRRVPFLQYL